MTQNYCHSVPFSLLFSMSISLLSPHIPNRFSSLMRNIGPFQAHLLLGYFREVARRPPAYCLASSATDLHTPYMNSCGMLIGPQCNLQVHKPSVL